MNIGGSAGQDDYGLPPVDVEIPDDARELDRDVQAYHRELRAQRRRRLVRRLQAPLTRHGVVLPLLAGCLALTLLAATMLAVLTAGQAVFRPGRPATAGSARPAPGPGRVGGPLPDAIVVLDGEATPVRDLAGSVLALIPPGCDCTPALRAVLVQAAAAGIRVYLVGTDGAQVAPLARQIGLTPAFAAQDAENLLAATYHPAGLTAVLVRSSGTVAEVVARVAPGTQLKSALRSLRPARPMTGSSTGTASPG